MSSLAGGCCPKIERYYEPTPYDERKIFFDLGQGTQHVTTIDHLYQQLAERVRTALDASNAAIFVRDDASGNFNLRVLSAQGGAAETDRAVNVYNWLSVPSSCGA